MNSTSTKSTKNGIGPNQIHPEAALNWTEANEMIANLEKFYVMFSHLTLTRFQMINQQSIDIRAISLKSETNVMLL